MSQADSLRASSTWLFGAQLYYKATGLLFYLILSRTLLPRELGIYFYACSLCQSAIFLGSLNVNPLIMRRVAAGTRPIADEVAGMAGFRLTMAPVYLVGMGAIVLCFHRDTPGVLLICAVFTLTEDVYYSFGAVFVGLGRVRYNAAIGLAVQTLFVGATWTVLGWRPALTSLLIMHVGRSLLLLAAGVGVTAARIAPVRIRLGRAYAREALPFVGLAVFSVLADQVDTILMGSMLDYDSVASYGVAIRAVGALLFVGTVSGTVLYPRLVAGGLEPALFRRAVSLVTGIGLLAALGFYALAGPASGVLFPARHAQTAALLRSMSPLVALSLPQAMLTALLPAIGEERRALLGAALGTVLMAAGDLVALPRWGVAAAPWVRTLSCGLQLAVAASGFVGRLPTPPAATTATRGSPTTTTGR